MDLAKVLVDIPERLRIPLLKEYESVVRNFSENRWRELELAGGIFCEIVFNVLDGHAKNSYLAAPHKPSNFVDACKALEKNNHVPRSFQILIPRLLPALYEVRNNRGVGHAGGDVDSNHMDATFVVTSCNWVMAELVRVFHHISTRTAQDLVDNLVERRVPLIWEGEDMRRILVPKMTLIDQVVLLVATSTGKISTTDLLKWTDYEDKKYFMKLLRKLHKPKRFIELSSDERELQILPPGSIEAGKIVQKYTH